MDISSAFVSIKTALELNNLLQTTKIDADVKKKSSELTNIIISLQQTISLAHAKNHEITEINNKLRSQIMKMSNWQKEAKRCEFHELSPGVLVFKLKKDHHNSEPLHYLCPNCHQDERKSILQKKTESSVTMYTNARTLLVRRYLIPAKKTERLRMALIDFINNLYFL